MGIRYLSVIGSIVCISAAPSARADFGRYMETFATTTYRDVAGTTALWDVGTGTIKLPPYVPVQVGSYNTSGEAYDVAVAGDLAYVADYGDGLRIISVVNRTNPMLVGTYDTAGLASGVAVAGDLAFVTNSSGGLAIINVTTPSTPSLLSTFACSAAQAVVVAGRLAFVANGPDGLLIVNITDPSSPTLAGSYADAGVAVDVAVTGDLLLVANASTGLVLVDISDPTSPTLAGTYAMPTGAHSIAVSGDMALAAAQSAGLVVIDISNPSSPTLAGSFISPGSVTHVVLSGDVAYVRDTAGLEAIDVSNPSSPTSFGRLSMASPTGGLAVDGDLAFVADRLAGLKIVDVADRVVQPAIIGNEAVPSGATFGIDVEGDVAFVGSPGGEVRIIDISDPSNPNTMSSYSNPVSRAKVDGDLLYVADILGLEIIDVSNPESPSHLGRYDFPSDTWGLDVSGDVAYVTSGGDLFVLDVTDPGSIAILGSYASPHFLSTITVDGDLACAVANPFGLYVFDVTNPASPTLAGTLALPGVYSDGEIAISGDMAIVVVANAIRVVSLLNPASPLLLGSCSLPGSVTGVDVAGDYAFVTRASGLAVVDIRIPASPTLVASIPLAGSVRPIVEGDHVFVTSEIDGLNVIQALLHDALETDLNVAKSLPVDLETHTIVRARATTTQTAGVLWELSANAGTDWAPIVPNNTWYQLAGVGTELEWRSTHVWSPVGNPSVSDLQIEWINESARMGTIEDVPNDQGGRVYVNWVRSGYDFADVMTNPVDEYAVYRRVDDLALLQSLNSDMRDGEGAAGAAPALPGVATKWIDGTQYVFGSGQQAAAPPFPPGTWVHLATVPATQSDHYLMEVTTAADSGETGTNSSVYVVTTHTTTPSVWFISETASGYSIDNIAPGVPSNFAVAYNTGSGNTLSWDDPADPDFQYFRVYRGMSANFTPSPSTQVHQTIATGWSDPDYDGWPVYYKVTALDHAGNESAPASTGTTTGVETSTPRTFALYANAPNPFNPSTVIRFDVPTTGVDVSLRIYDVAGRPVRTLVDGVASAGARTTTWDGRDDAGLSAASGVYFYRMTAGNFVQTRKMVLLK